MLEKKLSSKLSWLQAQYPEADIEVWCEDERRLGLQPILRRIWTPIGEQPIAKVRTKYEWVWLYGFVHPESGENKGVDTAIHKYRTIQSSFSQLCS